MKKFFILVISASVLLTGCVLPSFSKHRPRHSSESAASSRRTKSSSSSSSSKSSSSSSESTEIVSKTLVGDIEEIHHRDTITYQGKKNLESSYGIAHFLARRSQCGISYFDSRGDDDYHREGMQSDSNYVAAKSLEGVNIDYSVTADKKLQTLY